jgi:hypothetical protein
VFAVFHSIVDDTNVESVVVLARRKLLNGSRTVASQDRWTRRHAPVRKTLKLSTFALVAVVVS